MTIIRYVPAKKYRIKLTVEERVTLEGIRDKGNHKAVQYKRALAMLLSDESDAGNALSDSEIARVTGMQIRTIERLRKRCHDVGCIEALKRVPRETPPVEAKITGEVEAHITKIACSEVPDGHAHWTLGLIAEKLVELRVLDSISKPSVSKVLKKVNLNLGVKSAGVFPKNKMPPS